MKPSAEILFFFPSKAIALRQRNELKQFLSRMAKKEGRPIVSLNIIFCSDAQLLQINQSFLQHDDYTDIITFDLSVSKKEPITAEIYISVERVRENAKTFQTTINRELHRVIFHGVLHLCGYSDKKPKEVKLMREKEAEWLGKYFR